MNFGRDFFLIISASLDIHARQGGLGPGFRIQASCLALPVWKANLRGEVADPSLDPYQRSRDSKATLERESRGSIHELLKRRGVASQLNVLLGADISKLTAETELQPDFLSRRGECLGLGLCVCAHAPACVHMPMRVLRACVQILFSTYDVSSNIL